MKVLFIAAGAEHWGSSRLRAWNIVKYWPEADAVVGNDALSEIDIEQYDSVIFQKTINIELAEYLKERGIRMYWDVCDPSWWWDPEYCKAVDKYMTGVVSSSKELARDYQNNYNRRCDTIPDRLDLAHYAQRRTAHTTGHLVRFIWYGVSVNRVTLTGALVNLERMAANQHQVQLTIFDNGPIENIGIGSSVLVYFSQWKLGTEVKTIASHDIALLPPYPGPWGQVKSNNKELTAYACGLPQCSGHDYDEMLRLAVSPQRRQLEADNGWLAVQQRYQVQESISEWKALLERP